MIRETVAKFGKIDILVNNAGVARRSDFLNLSIDDFQRTLDTNLYGTFLCSKYAAREMISQKRDKIVNVASIRGLENCAEKTW